MMLILELKTRSELVKLENDGVVEATATVVKDVEMMAKVV